MTPTPTPSPGSLGSTPAQPRRPALLAEHDGVAIAAVALTSGAGVADPSYPTAAAVRALRRRRYRLLRQGGDVAPLRSLRRHLTPATP